MSEAELHVLRARLLLSPELASMLHRGRSACQGEPR
jgi:hypothetical protein